MKNTEPEELDRRFDEGDPLSELVSSEPYGFFYGKNETRQVALSLPAWLVGVLDEEAARRGIARKALVNVILVDWADRYGSQRRTGYSRLWQRDPEDYQTDASQPTRPGAPIDYGEAQAEAQ